MTTPKREDIERLALELWQKDQYRNGCSELSETTPEYAELAESGYIMLAQNMLMRGDNYREYIIREENAQQLTEDTVDTLTDQLKPQPFMVDTLELMKTGVFLTGTRQCGKSNLAKLIVQKLISEGKTVFIIDPTQVWQQDFDELSFLVVSEPHGQTEITWNLESTIFDVSQLTPKSLQRFTELFCTALFNRAVATPKPLRPQIVATFEEAHTAMENNRLNGKAYQNTKRFLTQGGNYGLSFIAITQFPALVDKLPLKAAQQRYFGKTSEPNDLKYLRAYLGETVKQLASLPLGQFLYTHSGHLTRLQTEQFKNLRATQSIAYTYNCAGAA
jgi:hypothetical protein